MGKANPKVAAGVGGGVLAAALLGGLSFRFLKRRKRKASGGASVEKEKAIAGSPEAKKAPGQSIEGKIQSQIQENRALKERQELEILSGLKLPETTTKKSEVLAKHMNEQAKEGTGRVCPHHPHLDERRRQLDAGHDYQQRKADRDDARPEKGRHPDRRPG